METWIQRLGGGKNVKFFYYLQAYAAKLIPRKWLIGRRRFILKKLRGRADFPQLKERIDYYCNFLPGDLPANAQSISGKQEWGYCPSVYLLDSERIRRYFPKHLKWQLTPGDNVSFHSSPMVVKSRPIGHSKGYEVLLKLNRVRHFIFLKDRRSIEEKRPIAVFRGSIGKQMRRLKFIRKFEDSPLVDAGCIDPDRAESPKWLRPKMSLYEHLKFRYIVSLEGNDVASNLKWAMHSNSVVIMPRPRYETWFMEGKLRPGVHYIEIKDDFSDLEEKILYYNSHLEEAKEISRNAMEWTRQFENRKLERALEIAVLHYYFVKTGQLEETEI